eukprot:XP_011423335.1 PREDICTED: uncharacterized protein LOC105325461 isoform X2 [Crassostrea gigas]
MDVLIYFSFMTAVVAGKQHTNQTDIDASRNGSTGIITSPGYPGNYPNNVAYTWTLKTGNLNATVSFNFQDFDIIKYRYTPHCEDYLQIYETEPCCFKAMHRCDKYKPVSLTVRGSVITITFESDNLHNSKGFHLTWTVYIPRTPAVSTTSLWTSKLQTKSSAKITGTTGPKIMGTTDPEIPTSKTENIIRTSSRTSTIRGETSIVKSNTRKMLTIFSSTKSVTEGNISIPTARTSTNREETSLVKNNTRKMLTMVPLTKSVVAGNISIPTARTSTNREETSLVKNNTRKMLTMVPLTKSVVERNIIVTPALSSTNKLQKSLVRNDKSKMLGIMLTIKSRTDRKTTIPTARFTTYQLEASQVTTNTTKKILTNFLSTKSKNEGNIHVITSTARASTNKLVASIVTTNPAEKMYTILVPTKSDNKEIITIPIVYLVTGISILQVVLTIIGVCIVKKRQTNQRSWILTQGEIKESTTHIYSSLKESNAYDCIKLQHQSNKNDMQEEIDATYIEIIEHEYDKVDPSSRDTDHLTERRDIEDNAMYIDDIKYDQAKSNSMKCDHLLAIAQITIESSDIKDEDKYTGSLNMLNTNHMNNDHGSTASATI